MSHRVLAVGKSTLVVFTMETERDCLETTNCMNSTLVSTCT